MAIDAYRPCGVVLAGEAAVTLTSTDRTPSAVLCISSVMRACSVSKSSAADDGGMTKPTSSDGPRLTSVSGTTNLFLATFRRRPTADAEGWIESEGGVGKVSVRRVF